MTDQDKNQAQAMLNAAIAQAAWTPEVIAAYEKQVADSLIK